MFGIIEIFIIENIKVQSTATHYQIIDGIDTYHAGSYNQTRLLL